MKKTIILLILPFLLSCNSKEKNQEDDSVIIETSEKIIYEELEYESFAKIKGKLADVTAHELRIKSEKVYFMHVLESESGFIWYAMENNQGTNKPVYQYKLISDKNFKKVTKSIVRGGPFAAEDEISKLTGH